MSTHTNRAAVAHQFLVELAGAACHAKSDDWQAGGSLADILHDLKREGHIGDTLYVDGCRLVHDLTRCHGSSVGLTARYGDQVDSGGSGYLPGMRQSDPDAFARVERVLSALRQHERRTLQHCILTRQQRRGGLAAWGRLRTAYRTEKTARAAGTGEVRALLETISELYRGVGRASCGS